MPTVACFIVGLAPERQFAMIPACMTRKDIWVEARCLPRDSVRRIERVAEMSDFQTFDYEPQCSYPGCDRPAIYKVAAPWTNGTIRELKTYGTACDAHRASLLARGRSHREGLQLAEGESVGQVGLYQLLPGVRDAELSQVSDEGL
jgi:hypothetical protein